MKNNPYGGETASPSTGGMMSRRLDQQKGLGQSSSVPKLGGPKVDSIDPYDMKNEQPNMKSPYR